MKINRANKHIADLESRITGLEDSIIVSIEKHSETGNELIKYDLQDGKVIDDVALLIGDAVHNLKCALDYPWAIIIEKHIPALLNFVKFPVYPTSQTLEAALRGKKIDVSLPRLYDLVVSEIKPYDGGDFAIWPVHQLDRDDKHRLLIPVFYYSSTDQIEIENESGERQRGFTMGTTDPFPHYLQFPRGWHVKNHGKPTTSVMFQYGEFGREFRPVDTLRLYSQHILGVVELLEEFIES